MIRHLLILLAIIPTISYGWGQPATTTTTVEARITHWTEDPCDFPQHQDKCEIKQELNIPVVLQAPQQTSSDGHITNYE